MGPMNNQGDMDTSGPSPGIGGAGSLGASSDAMNDFNTTDTLATADESIGQVDATDQNELEWNAGAQPGDRAGGQTDTRTDTRSATMGNTPLDAGNQQDGSQESITEAVERGDVQRGGQNEPQGVTPVGPTHDPFKQGPDYANDPNYAKDPVCGTWVDKRTATNTLPAPVNMPMDTLYFESPECKALFEEDPAKYGSNF